MCQFRAAIIKGNILVLGEKVLYNVTRDTGSFNSSQTQKGSLGT
jgi:hypothetical protein